MSNIAAMIEAVDFIEDHLRAEIGVSDVAEAVSYSLYHFCRMFSRVVHHTPYDYLMRRRLSESARALVETERRILDIALEYRFNSPETYSRAFKRMFGLQPNRWRKQGTLDRWSLLLRLTPAHVEHVNKGDHLRPVLETRHGLKVAGLMTLVRDGPADVARLWETLAQELGRGKGMPGGGLYYGLAWFPAGWEARGYPYLAGIGLAEGAAEPGSSLVVKALPPSQYARFVHKGGLGELGLTRDYVYQTWLPRSGQRPGALFEVQDLGAAFPDVADPDGAWSISIPVIEPPDA